MVRYQLRLGNETLSSVIDRIAADATAVAPGLGRARARRIADALFRQRVIQSSACGTTRECHSVASLWGSRTQPGGPVRPCCIEDDDPFGLPNVFAREAAALFEPLSVAEERDALEDRLASVFRAVVAPLLFRTDYCGDIEICRSPATDPFTGSGR